MKKNNKGMVELYLLGIAVILGLITFGVIKSSLKFENIETNSETIQSNQDAIEKLNKRITALEIRISKQAEQ